MEFVRVGKLMNTWSGRFAAESMTIFNAFTTPPTYDRKVLIDNTVKSLIVSGVWQNLDLLYFTAAADAQAARVNWKNPSLYLMSEVNILSFTADRGYTGNGIDSRLLTGWAATISGNNFVQDSASIWLWSRTSTGLTAADIGGSAGSFGDYLGLRSAVDTSFGRLNDGTTNSLAQTDGSGFHGHQRPSASIKRRFRNGVQYATDITASSTGMPTQPNWMCGRSATDFSMREQACGAWGNSLAGLEATFFNSVSAYMAGVGAA